MGKKVELGGAHSSDATAFYKSRGYTYDEPKKRGWFGEDAVGSTAGGGAIAGIGVGPQGEPPGKKKTIMSRLLKRRALKYGLA
jgi:hypothetical protein